MRRKKVVNTTARSIEETASGGAALCRRDQELDGGGKRKMKKMTGAGAFIRPGRKWRGIWRLREPDHVDGRVSMREKQRGGDQTGHAGDAANSSVASRGWPDYCSNTTTFLLFLFSSNYSQICIATLKSPKTKVVQLLEISNFDFWTKLRF
jgi:hypothetical protein